MNDDADSSVSAIDFHTLRCAFKSLVAEGLLPEATWVDHAEEMVRDLTGSSAVDPEIILRIIRK
ncbi:hypothetical protein BPNPMPFG_002063 [Mesorhizobium sp. AR07]|uniref:hypothetical protein n=1 Tax=Mesorhizobium sp. AR07 TaxID=2865838 RepID=UPI00215EDF21|nr:hypothetical protein [Mesorhizobium sp. AR07]UVK46419.1 hypothetical protein BPNPMPFG_002063 [Mesorhizobium sp. AR07]